MKQAVPPRKNWNEKILSGTDAAALQTIVDAAALIVVNTPQTTPEDIDVLVECSRYRFTRGGIGYLHWEGAKGNGALTDHACVVVSTPHGVVDFKRRKVCG